MLKPIPFKLSFKLFQWMLVLIIAFSTYLGYEFYQVTFQAQVIENKRFWIIAQLGEYRSRNDRLIFLSRQYVANQHPSILSQYQAELNSQIHLLERDALSVDNVLASTPNEVGAEGKYRPFSINERILLARAMAAGLRLRELEQKSFALISSRLALSGSLTDIDLALYSSEYLRVNLEIVTLINQLLESVTIRLQQKIGHMGAQRAELVFVIPLILVLNLVLLLMSFMFINRRMNKYHQELKSLTTKDFLTGVHNRKYLMETGPLLLSLNQREQTQVAVLMLDIDKFKSINDQYGHDAGDEVLISFGHVITERLRKGDIFSRIGGEEFVLILNKVTEVTAEHLANEIRELLAKQCLVIKQGSISYTVSIGVVMSDDISSLPALISQADKALYHSKDTGRNKVTMLKREPFSVALTV